MKHLFILFSATILMGCSTFKSNTQSLSVNCAADDVTLFINGTVHQNPVQLDVQRDENIYIQCQKEGYHTSQKIIKPHLNGAGIADAIGGFIFWLPGIGLITPGAYSLDTTNVHLDMQSK